MCTEDQFIRELERLLPDEEVLMTRFNLPEVIVAVNKKDVIQVVHADFSDGLTLFGAKELADDIKKLSYQQFPAESAESDCA